MRVAPDPAAGSTRRTRSRPAGRVSVPAKFELPTQLREASGTGGEPDGLHGEIRCAAPLLDRATITALAQGLRSAITLLHNEIHALAA
ncbi:hypothetical protein [Nocardia gipuzkoensis]|uniref:hypothetical protein n=1 Tax=Nocardia gipuzkoensis TaxID=2749991 RepID=UPI00237DE9DE|nr:hypothetical protein [Nocardia gipuzkoensis]MDE1673693.1 hypothetical protein [Nocardia gipuzkoensis]